MRIDRKMNLVFPVDTEKGTVYVHTTPISREVFELHFLVISQTFAALYQQGLNIVAGPRIAAMMLKDLATKQGNWDGPDGVKEGLVAEMRRLTMVAVPGEKGWQMMPFDEVCDRGILDEDDQSEVEGAVTFFTCVSAMHRRDQLPGVLAGMASLWDAQITSLNFTAYVASLPTLTEEPSTTTATSSVPS